MSTTKSTMNFRGYSPRTAWWETTSPSCPTIASLSSGNAVSNGTLQSQITGEFRIIMLSQEPCLKTLATAGRRYSAGRWHIPSKRIHVHPMLTIIGNTDYKLMDKIPLCLQLRASLWTVPHLIANGMSGQFGVPAPSHVSVESDKDLEKSWKRPNMAASHAREIPKSLSHAMTFLVQDQVRGEYKVIKIF